MRPVASLRPRARAAGLVLTLAALAAVGTAGSASRPAPGQTAPGQTAPGQTAPGQAAPDQAAADVLHAARNQLGDPYLWGGNGPDDWDCSGLTSLWGSVGGVRGMPRVSRDQQAWAVALPAQQALPGDLVFFGHPVTHVGLYLGGGRMVDAAESRGAVVERAVWRAGVVRYGRVPRRGMVKVRAWTPPPLPPLPTTSPGPADGPVGAEAVAPRTSRSRPVAPAPPSGLAPLAGLPGKQAHPSSRTARAAAANATTVRGSTAWDDLSLVRTAWRHAGGQVLPTSRAALVAGGRPVALRDARVGDLVVYGAPATHLGLYLGHGDMVDASRTLGRVVVRRVYASSFTGLVRLG